MGGLPLLSNNNTVVKKFIFMHKHIHTHYMMQLKLCSKYIWKHVLLPNPYKLQSSLVFDVRMGLNNMDSSVHVVHQVWATTTVGFHYTLGQCCGFLNTYKTRFKQKIATC